ncbi:MAG TPA: discoidin domain-containing protein [Dokdonella sp.]|uniref:discoidin domain-containing protein n=1 Tax=Dokdonella sp. TaxID=2291710 RepID=UPI002C1EE6F9|nr:discoidin domain-containing protein [Dokdonella sp.]HUD42536.1 discoidin domain-containing protein [Dokdonella sp.]
MNHSVKPVSAGPAVFLGSKVVNALACLAAVFTAGTVEAYVPPSRSLAPAMGWNTWYSVNIDIDAQLIADMADALVTSGLRDLGYTQVGIDAGWWMAKTGPARDANNDIIVNPGFFTGTSFTTMKGLADYVHSKGLTIGIYTDTGSYGCVGHNGSGGFEVQDAALFANWGIDHLKVDHCGGNISGRTTEQSYLAWRDAISLSGRPITLNICNWGEESPWTWGPGLGQSWRSGRDIWFSSPFAWNDVLFNFDSNYHPGSSGPGAFNDPDFLIIGPQFGSGLSATEEQSYFGMWAISAAPLILAADIRGISPATKAIVGNPEVIAVNQDTAYMQGVLVAKLGDLEVYAKPLAEAGERAVLLLNRGATAATITANWSDIGVAAGPATVRDLYAHADLGTFVNSYTSPSIPSHGSMMIKLTGTGSSRLYAATSVIAAGFEASRAMDGNPATIWHSSWDDRHYFPQYLLMDLGANSIVNQVRYLPRQDQLSDPIGGKNGVVTDYRIETRTASGDWVGVASGSWPIDTTEKYAFFPARQARFVRLVALSGFNGFASAAELSADHLGPSTGSLALPVSASASSVYMAGFEAPRAIDGNLATMWHSSVSEQWMYPQYVTLDLGSVKTVRSLTYVPRQDQITDLAGRNGVIKSYILRLSKDGLTYTTAASGNWPVDMAHKTIIITETPARYVRLEASDGYNGFVSAAEVRIGIQ